MFAYSDALILQSPPLKNAASQFQLQDGERARNVSTHVILLPKLFGWEKISREIAD